MLARFPRPPGPPSPDPEHCRFLTETLLLCVLPAARTPSLRSHFGTSLWLARSPTVGAMPVHEGSDEGFWKVVLMFFSASFGFGFLAGILVMTRFFKASRLPAATITSTSRQPDSTTSTITGASSSSSQFEACGTELKGATTLYRTAKTPSKVLHLHGCVYIRGKTSSELEDFTCCKICMREEKKRRWLGL